MWTAHCSYVSQLLPPKVYVQANQVMLDDTLNNPNRDDFSCLRPRVPEQHNHVGLQRYAPERWIFDHPNVNPCSVFPMRLADAPLAFPQKWTPRRKPVPPTEAGGKFGFMKYSYSRLVGRLYTWKYLYGKGPPKDSWVWKAYKNRYDAIPGILKECLNVTNITYQESLNYQLLQEFTPYKYRQQIPKIP
eukprot:CAMPEP_0172453364 /NCGR_PEP_ID=MMETSP1065-20121228/10722_1 /TAXON_ID=265537 /ORGANISM="Amphiprora paludosa, Strain CCMP125" /LENGTH=188 /DNA_ID=CAMNT_0013205543 /DNA_START=385 /DNA_END=951 /DNA_ORIENTATION=-